MVATTNIDFIYREAADIGLPYGIASSAKVHFAIVKEPVHGKNIVWDLGGRNLLALRDFVAEEHLSITNANIIVALGDFRAHKATLDARRILLLNSDLVATSLQASTAITKISLYPYCSDAFKAYCKETKLFASLHAAQLYGLIMHGTLEDKLDIINALGFFANSSYVREPKGGVGSAEASLAAVVDLDRLHGRALFYKESSPPPSRELFLTLQQAESYIYQGRYEKSDTVPYDLCSFGPVAVSIVKYPLVNHQEIAWDAGGSTLLFLEPIKVKSLKITNAKALLFLNTVQAEFLSIDAERTLLFRGMIFCKESTLNTLLIEQPVDPDRVSRVAKLLELAVMRSSPRGLIKALTALLRLYSNLSLWPSTEIFHALAFLHNPPFSQEKARREEKEGSGGGGGGAAAAAAAAAATPPLVATASFVPLDEEAEESLDIVLAARPRRELLLADSSIVEIVFPLVGEVRFYDNTGKLPRVDVLDLKGADLVILSDLKTDYPLRLINARRVVIFGTILTPSLEIKATCIHIINKLVISQEIKDSIVEVAIPPEVVDYIRRNGRMAFASKKADEALEAVAGAFDAISYCEDIMPEAIGLFAHLQTCRATRISTKASGGLSSWLSPLTTTVTTTWGHFTKSLEHMGMKEVLKASKGDSSLADTLVSVVEAVDGEYLEVCRSTKEAVKSPPS